MGGTANGLAEARQEGRHLSGLRGDRLGQGGRQPQWRWLRWGQVGAGQTVIGWLARLCQGEGANEERLRLCVLGVSWPLAGRAPNKCQSSPDCHLISLPIHHQRTMSTTLVARALPSVARPASTSLALVSRRSTHPHHALQRRFESTIDSAVAAKAKVVKTLPDFSMANKVRLYARCRLRVPPLTTPPRRSAWSPALPAASATSSVVPSRSRAAHNSPSST